MKYTQEQKNKVIKYACGLLDANITPKEVKESVTLEGLRIRDIRNILLEIDEEIEEENLPKKLTSCPKTKCIYNNPDTWIEDCMHPDYGTYENACESPRTGKGNCDSSCHKMSSREVSEMLNSFKNKSS